MVDRAGLAALRPEDVGLRRAEVAVLSDMSADYYSRLEQPRGPHPSEQMLTALSRGLRLSWEERDQLFRLAGYGPAPPSRRAWRASRTGWRTRPAVALRGDETGYTGRARSAHHRWFTDPAARLLHPEEDHAGRSRPMVADLHGAYACDGHGSRAGELVGALREESAEFAELWEQRPVLGPACAVERFLHPQAGPLEPAWQTLLDPDHCTESRLSLGLLSLLSSAPPPR